MAFLISMLSGPALQWARSLWDSNLPVIKSITAFKQHFREVFEQCPSCPFTASYSIFLLQENSSSYALQFCAHAISCGWNESVLFSAFRHGLNSKMRHQLVVYDDSTGLENLVQLTPAFTAPHCL